MVIGLDWIGLYSVLRPRQHSIGYMGDGFYRSKDPTNSIKVLKEKAVIHSLLSYIDSGPIHLNLMDLHKPIHHAEDKI